MPSTWDGSVYARYFSLEEMTIQDYFNLLSYNIYQKSEIIQGILEAQIRKVDYAELWLGKDMNLNKPFMIKIGEDIPINFLYGKAEIKWIESKVNKYSSAYFNFRLDTHLRKDQAFIFNPKAKNHYFELYQFPVQENQTAPILPKTDFYLFLQDSSNILWYDVEETIYNMYGVTIVKKFTSDNALILLANRIKLIEQSPTATNTILAMQIMEAILLEKAKEGKLDSFLEGAGEKTLDRFEKLKNLALSNDQFAERKLAVVRCYQTFKKLIGE